MATRVNRKNASATSTKEIVPIEKSTLKSEANAEDATKPTVGTVKNVSIAKKIAKNSPKKILKKPSIGLKMKAKSKKPVKLNQKLGKSLLQNNGIKEVKPRKRKAAVKKEKYDSPPVLEPIFPLEENIETKKQPRKRLSKKALKKEAELQDPKKIKVETDDTLSVSSDVTDISNAEIPNLPKQVRKPRAPKKPKIESDSLEDVMNDLTFLIKTEDIKKEVDSMSESGKSDTTTKPKKLTKRQRIEQLKKKIMKKENLENTLSKLDSAEEKVIDMLDLNVRKVKKKVPAKRRHSIEKFPIGSVDSSDIPIPQLSPFNSVPRSFSPRPKRNAKIRQSMDGFARRPSPYTTRSDSPARMLRNGKQRRLKEMNLLDGLESETRKRKRLCSDLSGSEMSVSKLSGYESDSSFSDLASLHGGETNDSKDAESKCLDSKEALVGEADDLPVVPAAIKRTASCETATSGPNDTIRLIDTNSNLCNNVIPVDINRNDKEIKQEAEMEEDTSFSMNPSIKVPEKSIILDIMKQTFNDENCLRSVRKPDQRTDFETEAVVVSKFYGKGMDTGDVLGDPPFEPMQTEEQLETEQSANYDDNQIYNFPKVETELLEFVPVNCTLMEDIDLKVKEDSTALQHQKMDMDATSIEKSNSSEITSDTKTDDHLTGETSAEMVADLNERKCPTEQELGNDVDVKASEAIDEYEFIPEEETAAEENCDVNRTEFSNFTSKEDDGAAPSIAESAEELAEKENVLKALGLQSLRAAEQAKHQKTKEKPGAKGDSYTGTLKTVIKINRDKKKGRNSFKMTTLQKNKGKSATASTSMAATTEPNSSNEDDIMKEVKSSLEYTGNPYILFQSTSTSWKQGNQSSDTAGAHRKSHYSNRSNMDGSSEHTSDGETPAQDGSIKALVIPEKASSFSIHPGRLCKDECSYCFGKFGLFDTPCHIAQMKSVERQNKILATEKHLTRDSCLCDACYRHVDRKSNIPSYTNKSLKRNSLVAPGPRQNHCHVLGCNKVSSNILRRKWIIKMRKSICQVINIDLDNPGLHSIPICDEHYSALEHLMICAMCKRRLARNHIHYLGPETNNLNSALKDEGIPLILTDKPVVCKLCKCFASIILKDPEERPENSIDFFKEYKRRLLHFNDIVPMDEAAAEEPIAVPSKSERLEQSKKKPKKSTKNSTTDSIGQNNISETNEEIPQKNTRKSAFN
ncbi:hypothetical protein NQ315_012733 [Exocentrus adspersus]|uniref:Uncharacterized protein n=1 Tax=Exocentrus adspersus TaxID=1586481 RepID=A0AAV8VF04_9CUCU|nr:hypothetical protein NQ315_012733 [Exocentrus adspersus]